MYQLITLEQFDRLVVTVALVGLPLGAIIGGLVAARRRDRSFLLQGLALGLLGPLAWLLWRLFRWTVRLDPTTGYVGLYRPTVLLVDFFVFLILGIVYKQVFARLRGTKKE